MPAAQNHDRPGFQELAPVATAAEHLQSIQALTFSEFMLSELPPFETSPFTFDVRKKISILDTVLQTSSEMFYMKSNIVNKSIGNYRILICLQVFGSRCKVP